MTGLPQMWNPVKRKPAEPDVPYEVQLWQQTLEDARRMQTVAKWNSKAARDQPGKFPMTEIRAAEQYAYVRWLMGIDDYWLTLPRTIHPRPDYARLPHQRLDTPSAAPV